ncbi:hypothetical protein D9M72_598860 [compost metagenome]
MLLDALDEAGQDLGGLAAVNLLAPNLRFQARHNSLVLVDRHQVPAYSFGEPSDDDWLFPLAGGAGLVLQLVNHLEQPGRTVLDQREGLVLRTQGPFNPAAHGQ